MENQHKQIKGYRDLNAQEIAAMNAIKQKGEELRTLISAIRCETAFQCDNRWVAIAETHLQQGIMALVRSVAQPDSF